MGRKKSELQRKLEESIKLARRGMLPSQQPKEDSLGRKLRDLEADMPTSLDDPDDLPKPKYRTR